jgi:two-component system, cell cycle sensor histidine kinase and response regulator CckA
MKTVSVASWTMYRSAVGAATFLAAALFPVVRLFNRAGRVTREMRESERRYRRLCEMSTDLIVEEDRDGRIRTINAGGAALCGHAPEELRGRSLADLLTPKHAERLRDARAGLVADPGLGSVAMEVELSGAGGVPLVVDLRSCLELSGGIPVGFLTVARDVTEHRRLEAQLRQSQKMEAVGRLAGGVAHDFNNMLTVILGLAELGQHHLDPVHPASESLRRILDAGQDAGKLLAQLLAFSRRQVMQPATMDPTEVLRSLEPMLHPLVGATVRLEMHLDPDAGWVRVDPNLLTQALINLAVNARDAMPGGGTLRFETARLVVGPGVRRGGAPVAPGAYVVFSVSDTGSGMDEATRAHIFEPFFTTKPEGEGTGLGLATVYGVVKQSGGYVWVESEPGHGARFDIYLPRANPEPRSTRNPHPMQKDGAAAAQRPTSLRLAADRGVEVNLAGHETILVAEDDAGVRELIARSLADLGYTVLSAPDGEAAVAAVRGSARLDLLLTDVTLPVMSGPQLAQALAGLLPSPLKVLYMSGNVAPLTNGTPATVDAPLIRKPFTTLALARRIREVLDTADPTVRPPRR